MGLKLIKRGGKLVSQWWYLQYQHDGKCHTKNLGIKVSGTPPKSLKLTDAGSPSFECSKGAAEEAARRFMEKLATGGHADQLTRTLLEHELGRKVEKVRLAELADLNENRPRVRRLSEDVLKYQRHIFEDFAAFVGCEYLHQVTRENVSAYFDTLKDRVAWQTIEKYIRVLSSAFNYFAPIGLASPFREVLAMMKGGKRSNTSIPRAPLNLEQIAKLFDAARDDKLLYPLAVCAACSGLRIGDVCNLKWRSVNLKAKPNPLILLTRETDTQTRKTGAEVILPIFAELREVLDQAATIDGDKASEYVFPEAAAIYATNRDHIFKRGKELFARALFAEDAENENQVEDAKVVGEEVAELSPMQIIEAVNASKFSPEKKKRVADSYNRYILGKTYRQIERETGRHRAQVSADLQAVEELTGAHIRPTGSSKAARRSKMLDKTRRERTRGNSASIYGWHSLRASFVVIALSRGVPIEIIRKVVGHTTCEMTQKYFNPTEKNAADVFANYMGGGILAKKAAVPAAVAEIEPPRAALPPPAASPSHSEPKTADGIPARLAKLDALLAAGIITQAERDERRRAILAEI